MKENNKHVKQQKNPQTALQSAKRVLDSLWLKRKELSYAFKNPLLTLQGPKRVLDILRLKRKE